MSPYTQITQCRICGNKELDLILDLGDQALTGVFPDSKEQKVTTGPLQLTKCVGNDACGLVQLRQTYNLDEMYGNNYGYRSGLNMAMCQHLEEVYNKVCELANLQINDLVIDIGSNDGTLLNEFVYIDRHKKPKLIGIDPVALKFKEFYEPSIAIIPEFFPTKTEIGQRAKIITSIAMFYDLPKPMEFMQAVHNALTDDGIWLFEQSYLLNMLEMNSYDTVCHEHLEYYALRQIKWMADRVGFKIIHLETNNLNGGSLQVIVAKKASRYKECTGLVSEYLLIEKIRNINDLETYRIFEESVYNHRDALKKLIDNLNAKGKKIFGYGASTKGNVILQYCDFTAKDIPYFAEVNSEKFGKHTPKTHIPIISEEDAKTMNPDYFLVMPWHFKDFILEKEQFWREQGGKFIFPLPRVEIV